MNPTILANSRADFVGNSMALLSKYAVLVIRLSAIEIFPLFEFHLIPSHSIICVWS
jgi:NADH:ubiquinone oxidoreductase subunit 4 (subunit M)